MHRHVRGESGGVYVCCRKVRPDSARPGPGGHSRKRAVRVAKTLTAQTQLARSRRDRRRPASPRFVGAQGGIALVPVARSGDDGVDQVPIVERVAVPTKVRRQIGWGPWSSGSRRQTAGSPRPPGDRRGIPWRGPTFRSSSSFSGLEVQGHHGGVVEHQGDVAAGARVLEAPGHNPVAGLARNGRIRKRCPFYNPGDQTCSAICTALAAEAVPSW